MAEKYGEKPKDFKGRVGYIWDYYKVHMVAALCVLALIFIALYTLSVRTNPDYVVIVAFSTFVTEENLEPLREFLQDHGEDINGDGEVLVEIINVSFNRYVLTHAQGTAADEQIRQGARVRLAGELRRGRAVIFITDDSYFDDLNAQFDGEIFADISELVSLPPEAEGAHFVATPTTRLKMQSSQISNFARPNIAENINFSIVNGDDENWQNSYDLLSNIFSD